MNKKGKSRWNMKRRSKRRSGKQEGSSDSYGKCQDSPILLEVIIRNISGFVFFIFIFIFIYYYFIYCLFSFFFFLFFSFSLFSCFGKILRIFQTDR